MKYFYIKLVTVYQCYIKACDASLSQINKSFSQANAIKDPSKKQKILLKLNKEKQKWTSKKAEYLNKLNYLKKEQNIKKV